MRISSYELVFGKHMNIGELIRITDASNLQYTQKEYYDWLVNILKSLHEGMRENRIEVKQEDKVYYDKHRKAVPVSWKIGDKVGLFDPTVKPHSNQVLTKKYFKGPYFIVDIVQGNKDIGPAYRLADVNTGKTHRYLVSADKLKRFDDSRVDFNARLTRLLQPEVSTDLHQKKPNTSESKNNTSNDLVPALKIIKERVKKGKREYFVLFRDNTKYWCDFVTPELLRHFRIEKKKRRARRRI